MALIRIRDMSLGYGGQLLFDRVSLAIEPNERVCLVGRTGEGKTTLLHIIEDKLAPDQGEIFRVPSIRIAALPQEISARLFTRPSNLLVMDEPTNDLDIHTLELLEELLDAAYGRREELEALNI